MDIEDIALQMTPGIGVRGAVHLLECFGDARSIFAASCEELVGAARLKPELARRLLARKTFSAAERELEFCRRNGIVPIASTDPEYPALLREIPDYPHVLYVEGRVAALSERTLSVVGTRKASHYGYAVCERFVRELAERVPRLCIVSGLAFGIDAAAHEAALNCGIPSVAVLPDALPGITPAQHTALARDIKEHGGALVTEVHSQMPRNGTGYVARNRIIAALSVGCLVVEAPHGSGALVTANFANDYDRAVLAVPGEVGKSGSAGTNFLISRRKAQLAASADDIIRDLMWDCGPEAATAAGVSAKPAAAPLTDEEARLLALFPECDPVDFETLVRESGCDPGSLSALLLGLELSDVVTQLPGNRYILRK